MSPQHHALKETVVCWAFVYAIVLGVALWPEANRRMTTPVEAPRQPETPPEPLLVRFDRHLSHSRPQPKPKPTSSSSAALNPADSSGEPGDAPKTFRQQFSRFANEGRAIDA